MPPEPHDPVRRGQWLRGVLDLCLLALLDQAGESYGYELAQALEQAGMGEIQGGTIYPVLIRLERTGLVQTVWRAGDSGPARKYYLLTDAGRHALDTTGTAWLIFADRVRKILHRGGLR